MQTWCKVLIVDDEILIRQGIKHYINWEQEGFQIIGEASNGEEALAVIKERQPQIVITDMVMPVMDGEELTKIIKRDYPQIEVIILSSFGDFDYVRSTFQHGIADYILKSQLEGPGLLKTLQQVAARLPSFSLHAKKDNESVSIERVIERIMSGYESEQDDFIMKQAFPHRFYCLFGVDVKKRGSDRSIDLLYLKEEIEQEITKHLPVVIYKPMTADQELITYLFNFDQDQLPIIKQFVRMIQNSVVVANFEIGWIVTEPFTDLIDLRTIYDEKLSALTHYRFYYPETVALIYDQLPSLSEIDEQFQLTRFTEAFKREQFEDALVYLEQHIEQLTKQYMTDEFVFKAFLGNVIFNVTILLGNMEYEHKELDKRKYAYIARIDEAMIAQDAMDQFSDFLLETKDVIAQKASDQADPHIQRLLDYIDAHYMDHLSLTEMAAHFHFNASYLSNYFSTKNNQGFSEYLNQVRIEKSIELLQTGAESIADISSLVGYSDHSYFCKVFKKLKGTSPSSYRRQYFRAKKGHK
ncbi:response regulator transcription factor [Sporosarcina sp. FSL K6-3457]|uniref:response regulator transcription factor n=1 Tax=Sporosarcina sp. FSL K6-3457 TaxID=2978204 RepID=UPI0030FACF49